MSVLADGDLISMLLGAKRLKKTDATVAFEGKRFSIWSRGLRILLRLRAQDVFGAQVTHEAIIAAMEQGCFSEALCIQADWTFSNFDFVEGHEEDSFRMPKSGLSNISLVESFARPMFRQQKQIGDPSGHLGKHPIHRTDIYK